MNPAGFAAALAPLLTRDVKLSPRQARREAAHFEKVRRAATGYGLQLRQVARHVGHIIRAFPPGDSQALPQITTLLTQYAGLLRPWATAVAQRMIAEVSRRDEQAWFKTAGEFGQALRTEIKEAPIGLVMQQILADQVNLITSIPLEAGQRVQELTQELVAGGKRYNEIIPMILNSGNVTLSRATLIARTETAKAASALTQARALHVGATHYVWMTSNDFKVRKAHKKLNGKVFTWNDPPIAEENGDRHHPGEFPNCRCWAAPVLPETF